MTGMGPSQITSLLKDWAAGSESARAARIARQGRIVFADFAFELDVDRVDWLCAGGRRIH